MQPTTHNPTGLEQIPNTEDRIRALLLELLRGVLRSDRTPKTLAEACIAIRTKAGISGRELAQRLPVHHSAISRIECGGKGTPALLAWLAEEAAWNNMHNTADYLRAESRFLEAANRRGRDKYR